MPLRIRFPSWLVLGLIAAASNAQDVSYEKYKLDNGMTVILHEDHSLPVAAVNLWYRVGSKDEPVRRSGFAHLFEHLMFMGTHRVPGSQFDLIMEAGGGSNNASTSSDRTNYFSAGPSPLLPTLLWLEADRLEDLARTMDQDKLDKQRDVVRNERRQQYENRPYGKADLEIQGAMYPPGHPYHIPVIGTHEDLEAATVSDVREFFNTFYVPSNVSLTVAGDFDPKAIKPLISDLFGSLPAGEAPKLRQAEPVKLDSIKRMTLYDKVQLPMVTMVYHSPAWYADGDAEMNLVAAVLSEGKTSRLYKRLVYDDKIAAEVSADQDSSLLGSLFRIDVLVNPGVEIENVEKAIDEEVERFSKEGPTEKELEKHKVSYELALLTGLQSVAAKADQLNEYEYIWGEPNSFKRDLSRFRNASPESVQKWAREVFTQNARLIVRVLPEGPDTPKSEGDKHSQQAVNPRASEPPPNLEALANRPKSPRDTKPSLENSKPFEPPMPEVFSLRNGIQVLHWPKKDLPIVQMTIAFLRGGLLVSDTDRAGVLAVTADMLDEGTTKLDALQYSDAMQQLGARFSTSAERDAILVSLTVLQRNFDRALELAADSFRRNRLDYSDFDRVRKLHLEELRQHEEIPGIVAARVADRALYGVYHRYGWPLGGTLNTIEKMTFEELKIQYATIIRPQYATVLIAGDIDRLDLQPLLEASLGTWNLPDIGNSDKSGIKLPQRDSLEVLMVHRPGAVQTVIHFIMPGPTFADPRRTQFRLLNTLLGGSFTSRLNMNLREDKGYTYGARSNFIMRKDQGHMVASSSVRSDATGEAIIEFLREFDRLSSGDITDGDVTKARESLRTDVIEAFSTLSGIIRLGFERVVNKEPVETLRVDVQSMETITAAQLNQLARTAIPLNKGVLVLVGDRNTIMKEIAEVNPDGPTDDSKAAKFIIPLPVEVDSLGNRLGS